MANFTNLSRREQSANKKQYREDYKKFEADEKLSKPHREIDKDQTVEHEKAMMEQFQTKGLRKTRAEQEKRLGQLKENRYRKPRPDEEGDE